MLKVWILRHLFVEYGWTQYKRLVKVETDPDRLSENPRYFRR
jgi:hypothetical protein